MRYYYLDNEKKPQGPHTAEELKSFLSSGMISADTLVASAGESSWKSLASVFSRLEEVKSSTWNNCSHCHANLGSDHVTAVCPECGKTMYCSKRGVWGTFVYVVRNAFNFRGRAGRREFWLFYLVYYIINIILSEIAQYCTAEQTRIFELNAVMPGDSLQSVIDALSKYFSDTVVVASVSVVSLYCLIMLFPFLSVSVRRLHDIGISAAPVICGCVSYMLIVVSLSGLFLMTSYLFDLVASSQVIDIQPAITELLMMLILGISVISFILISIFMVVCMFIPGHTGPNKFGPAPCIK